MHSIRIFRMSHFFALGWIQSIYIICQRNTSKKYLKWQYSFRKKIVNFTYIILWHKFFKCSELLKYFNFCRDSVQCSIWIWIKFECQIWLKSFIICDHEFFKFLLILCGMTLWENLLNLIVFFHSFFSHVLISMLSRFSNIL